MIDSNNIQKKLKLLREDYVKQLPVKIKEITGYWSRIQSSNGGKDDLEALHRLLHSIAGSGATFGFAVLGKQARYIEQILRSWLQGTKVSSMSAQEEMSVLLDRLKETSLVSDVSLPVFPSNQEMLLPPANEGGMLVYLLEGDAVLAQDLSIQLSHFGYQVKMYTCAYDLEVAVSNQQPALIIADVVLPEGYMAGIEVISGIHKNIAPYVGVIFISVLDDFDTRMAAVRAGGDDYFIKPINVSQLVGRMDKITIGHEVSEPYRVLIVEDDETLAQYYQLVLKQAGMIASFLTKPDEILESIASSIPELILMDVYMPDCSGTELARLIRQQDSYISIPIVYLSTETDYKKQLVALHLGADDFLTKPISDSDLVSSVTHRVQRARQLSLLMSQDSLTGLLKHTKIKEQLANELAKAKRQHAQITFVMIDIDHFKSVNDTYGHMVGDQVIKSLSCLLQQRLRKSDNIGRYGGEEFAVVMPNTGIEEAMKVTDEIRTCFANIQFPHENEMFSVTLSAGLAGYPKYDTAELVNQAADEALYEAKNNGRNCIFNK